MTTLIWKDGQLIADTMISNIEIEALSKNEISFMSVGRAQKVFVNPELEIELDNLPKQPILAFAVAGDIRMVAYLMSATKDNPAGDTSIIGGGLFCDSVVFYVLKEYICVAKITKGMEYSFTLYPKTIHLVQNDFLAKDMFRFLWKYIPGNDIMKYGCMIDPMSGGEISVWTEASNEIVTAKNKLSIISLTIYLIGFVIGICLLPVIIIFQAKAVWKLLKMSLQSKIHTDKMNKQKGLK